MGIESGGNEMKLKILGKSRTRERVRGDQPPAIVTQYTCGILPSESASDQPPQATVRITIVGQTIGDKDVDDVLELG